MVSDMKKIKVKKNKGCWGRCGERWKEQDNFRESGQERPQWLDGIWAESWRKWWTRQCGKRKKHSRYIREVASTRQDLQDCIGESKNIGFYCEKIEKSLEILSSNIIGLRFSKDHHDCGKSLYYRGAKMEMKKPVRKP